MRLSTFAHVERRRKAESAFVAHPFKSHITDVTGAPTARLGEQRSPDELIRHAAESRPAGGPGFAEGWDALPTPASSKGRVFVTAPTVTARLWSGNKREG